MDPQATWEELLRCYREEQYDEAREAANYLCQWLERDGFPPSTCELVPAGDALHRVIARAVVQHVLTSWK